MRFEELLRYTIPGYVILFPLILLSWFYSDPRSSSNGAWVAAFFGALVLIGPAVGFLAHQLYMFIHERSIYASPDRRNLALIIRKYKRQEQELPKSEISGSEALLAWDYFFHRDIKPGLRAHITRAWYFIHSFRGTAYAFMIGLAILVAGPIIITIGFRKTLTFNQIVATVFAASIYCLAAIFLRRTAWMTEQFLWPYEELAVVKNWPTIKKYLAVILEAWQKKDITCYKAQNAIPTGPKVEV